MARNSQEGQTLLIVVLVMVIAATVGLSVVSKSITSLRTSTEEANSAKALSAAEAGIQQQLQSGTSIGSGSFSANASYTTNIAAQSGTQVLLNGGNTIRRDEGTDLWLVPHNASNNPVWSSPWSGSSLTIYWGDSSGDCNNAALEILVITGSGGVYTQKRYVYDTGCPRGNNFLHISPSRGTMVDGINFIYSTPISVTNGLVVRIVPLYTDTSIGVAGSVALPSQGNVISSTGTSGTVARMINVFQGYPQLPSEFFNYGFFVPR